MTDQEKERFYDEQIAPEILRIANLCKRENISFLALVEYSNGSIGRTESIRSDACIDMIMTRLAALSKGNIDSSVMSMMKHARKNGHSSAVLKILGINPDGSEESDYKAKFDAKNIKVDYMSK